jgi:predicted ATPase
VLEALADVIAELAPAVLVIDDLQWADASTIAGISYLQRRCPEVGLALVAAARTEETPPDHVMRNLRPNTVIQLEPLTRAELAPLGIPDIFETTGGIPRFLTATVGKTRDSGAASTLAECLRTRYRAEGPWAYGVLLAASVLGPSFEPESLAALLHTDTYELTEELERLCERRILAVEGLGFRFRYEYVRRVLLSSVSPARRRLLEERLGNTAAPAAHARQPETRAMPALSAAARAR